MPRMFSILLYIILGRPRKGWDGHLGSKRSPPYTKVCPYHMTLYVNVPGWTLKSTFSLYSSGSEDPTVTDLLNRAKWWNKIRGILSVWTPENEDGASYREGTRTVWLRTSQSHRSWISLVLASLVLARLLWESHLCPWSAGLLATNTLAQFSDGFQGPELWCSHLCSLHFTWWAIYSDTSPTLKEGNTHRLPVLLISLLPQISFKSIIYWNNLFKRSKCLVL